MPEFENSGAVVPEATAQAAAALSTRSVNAKSSLTMLSVDEARRQRMQARGHGRPMGDAEIGGRNDYALRRRVGPARRDDDVSKEAVITTSGKEIRLSGHANQRGGFVRIRETNTTNGYFDRICVPAEALNDLIVALQDIAGEMHMKGLIDK